MYFEEEKFIFMSGVGLSNLAIIENLCPSYQSYVINVIKQIFSSYQFTRIRVISSYPHYNVKNQLSYKVIVGGIKQSFKINGSNESNKRCV